MNENASVASHDLLELTAGLVAAYVSQNAVEASALPGIISSVHTALAGLIAANSEKPTGKPVPPVPIKKSVTPDYLISLEDGRQYKSLKRHLRGRGLTPAEYRAKWGLPANYPMLAPNYAARRSEIAKSMGLGRKPSSAKVKAGVPSKARGRGRGKAA
jgi:predicted transcriptional regulator